MEAYRLAIFFGVLVLMGLLELWKPFRKLRLKRSERWPSNMGIVVTNAILLKLVYPVTAVAFAEFVQRQGWGLFNLWEGPEVLEIVLAIVILDMAIYWQHVAFHHVPILWRLHRMHHADTDFDVTTGARFHPLEILMSMLIKFWVILALGPAAFAVFLFEVILNACAMFNHSNISLPRKIDSVLRWVLVTPDMHRIHHSVIVRETNSNYGFNLPWWDRLFGTYIKDPENDPQTMDIGLKEFRADGDARMDQLLLQPFRK